MKLENQRKFNEDLERIQILKCMESGTNTSEYFEEFEVDKNILMLNHLKKKINSIQFPDHEAPQDREVATFFEVMSKLSDKTRPQKEDLIQLLHAMYDSIQKGKGTCSYSELLILMIMADSLLDLLQAWKIQECLNLIKDKMIGGCPGVKAGTCGNQCSNTNNCKEFKAYQIIQAALQGQQADHSVEEIQGVAAFAICSLLVPCSGYSILKNECACSELKKKQCLKLQAIDLIKKSTDK